jgi:hypothetical protein
MEEISLEKELVKMVVDNMKKSIKREEFFKCSYENRIDLMPIVSNVYKKLDPERLEALIVRNLEEHIAKKIVDKVTTERVNDIKKMMANVSIRDDLKYYMRTAIQKILDKVRKP